MSIKIKLTRLKRGFIGRSYKLYDQILDTDKYIRYTYYNKGYHNPNYQFDKEQISFIHVPKTAGTSLAKMLERDKSSRFINLDIHRPISKYCNPKEYKYITVMRSPVDRVWSYYNMVLRNPEGYPYKNYADQGLSRFLDKCWASRNLACRYLSGQVYEEPTKKTLMQANENLKSFHAVLWFENFKEESIDFLNQYDIEIPALTHERMSSYQRPQKEEIELIKRYNEYDIKIYERWVAKERKIKM